MPEITHASETAIGRRAAQGEPARISAKKGQGASDLWRRPVDLDPEMAARLLHGLAENHRHRLEVFVRSGDRVSMHELLAVTDDSDIRVLSYFQGALSRKLRRLLADRDKKVHLIGWDFQSTQWDDEHTKILDGVCYVTPATRESLRQCLGYSPASGSRRR